MVFAASAGHAQDEEFKDKGIIVNVDLERSSLLQGNRLGLQLDGFTSIILDNDSAMLTYLSELETSLMRFPSGHAANYVGYAQGRFSLSDSSKQFSSLTPMLDVTGRWETICRYLGEQDIQLVYVANVLTGDTSDLKRVLLTCAKYDVDVVGVELGYELYDKRYKHQIKKVDSYVDKVRPFISMLRPYDEDIKISLVAMPVKKYTGLHKHSGDHKKWNEKVAAVTGVDAFSMEYVVDLPQCFKKENLERNFDCAMDELVKFAYETTPDHFTELAKTFDRRELWLSSISIGPKTKTIDNTFFEANLIYDLVKGIIEYNIEDSGRVAQYFYGKSYSDTSVTTLFSKKTLIEREYRVSEDIYRRAAFYPIKFLSGIHNQIAFKLNAAGAHNIPGLLRSKQVTFIGYYAPETKTGHFFFVNKTENPLRLDQINFKGKLKYRRSKGKIEIFNITATRFHSGVGITRFTDENNIYENSEFYLSKGRKIQPKDFIVPSQSIYYIKILIR